MAMPGVTARPQSSGGYAMAHSHVITGATETPAPLEVRKIGLAALKEALRRGLDDFLAMPTHAVFLCLIYPIVALVLARLTLGYDVLSLLYPLAAGFALVGPLAAIGFYELSRQREQGRDVSWRDAFDVFHSPSIGAIAVLGVLLMIIFAVWIAVAQAIYVATFGYVPAASIPDFAQRVATTPEGWMLIVLGNGIGFLFAVLVLAVSAISFPLLLDREAGAAVAVLTSVRAVLANPLAMAAWGLIVAALLVIGMLPFFIGLAIVLPILGHATWHLYRRLVPAPEVGATAVQRPAPHGRRYAAQFPASLFAREREHS
jgi:uncharacterized membrane protein